MGRSADPSQNRVPILDLWGARTGEKSGKVYLVMCKICAEHPGTQSRGVSSDQPAAAVTFMIFTFIN